MAARALASAVPRCFLWLWLCGNRVPAPCKWRASFSSLFLSAGCLHTDHSLLYFFLLLSRRAKHKQRVTQYFLPRYTIPAAAEGEKRALFFSFVPRSIFHPKYVVPFSISLSYFYISIRNIHAALGHFVMRLGKHTSPMAGRRGQKFTAPKLWLNEQILVPERRELILRQ